MSKHFSITLAGTLSNHSEPPQPLFPTAAFDVVAIATSAGGLQALNQVLSTLPANFPIAILIVQHLSPDAPSVLVNILKRHTALIVKQAITGEPLQASTVYVAPPDWHLLVNVDRQIALSHTQPIHFTRPAADVLFESVAEQFRERAIAVVLTGSGRDGAEGIQKIKQRGGTTIAQDLTTAQYPGMPAAAIQTHAVDWVLPLAEIAPQLLQLTNDP